MWIHLSDAFLSIVAVRDRPDVLLVRARARGDIEQAFAGADVTETPDRDYRFRALLPRPAVELAISERIAAIDYTNFKNSVIEEDRHWAYHRCWTEMHRYQLSRLGTEARTRRGRRR